MPRPRYLWPPSQLPDFALGVVAAELAAARAAEQAPRRTGAGLRADAVALVVAAIVLFAPNPGLRYRLGEEIWFDHGLGPLLALFLYVRSRGWSSDESRRRRGRDADIPRGRVAAAATGIALGTSRRATRRRPAPPHLNSARSAPRRLCEA